MGISHSTSPQSGHILTQAPGMALNTLLPIDNVNFVSKISAKFSYRSMLNFSPGAIFEIWRGISHHASLQPDQLCTSALDTRSCTQIMSTFFVRKVARTGTIPVRSVL